MVGSPAIDVQAISNATTPTSTDKVGGQIVITRASTASNMPPANQARKAGGHSRAVTSRPPSAVMNAQIGVISISPRWLRSSGPGCHPPRQIS